MGIPTSPSDFNVKSAASLVRVHYSFVATGLFFG